eukprot:8745751-Pyramimonas_sp.AAC.1
MDTAAWHTFKPTPGGAPAADSCAAFFADCPGTCPPLHPQSALREMYGGILETVARRGAQAAVAARNRTASRFKSFSSHRTQASLN